MQKISASKSFDFDLEKTNIYSKIAAATIIRATAILVNIITFCFLDVFWVVC